MAPAQLCTDLKANAYGHGLAQLAPIAVAMGTDYLGICTNPEAATIRQLGLEVKLMRLRFGLPEEYEQSAHRLHIEEQVGTVEAAEFLAQLGRDRVNRYLSISTLIPAWAAVVFPPRSG